MPPCTWMLRLAHYVGGRAAASVGGDGRGVGELLAAAAPRHGPRPTPPRWPARRPTSMLAQWCLTAWNVAIGRPNCSRTLAYSPAMLGALAGDAGGLGGEDRAGQVGEQPAGAPGSTVGRRAVERDPRRRGGSGRGSAGVSTVDAARRGSRRPRRRRRRRRAARRPARRRAPRRRRRTPCRRVTRDVAAERDARRSSTPSASPGSQRAWSVVTAPPRRAPRWRSPSARTARARRPGPAPRPRPPARAARSPSRRAPRARAARASRARRGRPRRRAALVCGLEQGAGGGAGAVLGEEVGRRLGQGAVVVGDGDRHVCTIREETLGREWSLGERAAAA